MNKNLLEKISVSILSVVIGLVIGAILMAVTGYNPLDAFTSLIDATVSDLDRTGLWLTFGSILILCGLSVGFAYKTGLFNIGAEGQFLMGSLVSVLIGVNLELPNGLHMIVALLGGVIAGALWAFIPGFLKAFWGISEVVVTIMMNWIALYTSNMVISSFFHSKDVYISPTIEQTARIDSTMLTNIFGSEKFTWAFAIALIAIVIYWFILKKTKFGYEIKAVGFSNDAAKYAGIKYRSRIIYTMLISGAFAGLAGAVYSLGIDGFVTTLSSFKNYGFDGIVVAMLGQVSGGGILLSSLLLGALRNGAAFMDGVPSEIVDIMIGLIFMVSALGSVVLVKLKKKKGGK